MRLGVLAAGPLPPDPVPPASHFAAFQQALHKLGWVEGQNVAIEYRFAEGQAERLPALAAELVQRQVDLIVAVGLLPARAAQQATATVPIIMVGISDPVAFALVADLAHPGGNVTGVAQVAGRELEGKRLELLKEAVPTITRVAMVVDSTSRLDPAPVQAAARALGLTLLLSGETASPAEFQSTFTAMERERADALYVPGTPVNLRHHSLIVELAARYRLPAIYSTREFVDAGGLMAYGPSFPELFRRTAVYVDKILKGVKPADLPVEQPMKFELVINLKTAKTLGLTMPPSLLVLADEVIR
jgi:putative ABC transport system substrate-binding protein